MSAFNRIQMLNYTPPSSDLQYVLATVTGLLYNLSHGRVIVVSLFGEHLRILVDSHKINIYGLAKSTGLERTAIHKIISGSRIPSDEYAYKLADALPLSPEEKARFLESFNISKIGELKYRQRIQVKNLIESIAYIENETGTAPATIIENSPLGEANTTANGHFAVNRLVKSVIAETIVSEGNPEFDYIVPESYQYFHNELLACYLRYPELKMRHIIAFTKTIDFMDNYNVNLTLLAHVLPFAFAPGAGYHPYFFYRTAHDTELMQAMPYFILTATKLVLINRDFSKAALICDINIVELYKESFDAMLNRAKPLIKHMDTTIEFLESFALAIDNNVDEPFYWLEPEPCIGPLCNDKIIDDYIKKDLPNRDELVGLVCKHYGFLREQLTHIVNVCTTDGVYRVINTGYIYNAPAEIMHPFSRETVKELLITLRNRSAENKTKMLFSNPSKLTMPSKTHLNINRKNGVCFVMHEMESTNFRAIFLSEDSINEAFADFMESIEESGLVYTEKDSLIVLDSIINGL